MGTTTFFLRHNDSSKPLNKMGKKELEKLNNLSPYDGIPGTEHLIIEIPKSF